jgi:hypothetical protein
VTPPRPVTHLRCRLLLGEVPHEVEKPVPGPSSQVGLSGEQRTRQQVRDRTGTVVTDHGPCCLAVEGPHEH